MPSSRQDKQTSCACACFACSHLCLCRGSVQAARSLCARGPVPPCPCDGACACAQVQRESLTPGGCMPAQCVGIVLVAGGTYGLVAGHPRVLSRAHVHVHACPLQGLLPLGTLSWWGRRRLHKPVPNCLAFCWPFNMLVSCWAQPLLKVTIKWQQPWHLLTSHSAQLKGLVASQRGGPECPLVC